MTLADQAYIQLRQDIVSGALNPGQALRMAELSKRYGMGFSPLREALNRLSADRLVTSSSLRGFKVSPISEEEAADTTATRILVETRALALSIEKGDDDWEAAIVAALHALDLETRRLQDAENGDLWRMEKRHHAFHLALISACGSKWLLDFFERLYAESERYRYPALAKRKGLPSRDIGKEHVQLAKATMERDAATATDLLAKHYRKTAESIQVSVDPCGT